MDHTPRGLGFDNLKGATKRLCAFGHIRKAVTPIHTIGVESPAVVRYLEDELAFIHCAGDVYFGRASVSGNVRQDLPADVDDMTLCFRGQRFQGAEVQVDVCRR